MLARNCRLSERRGAAVTAEQCNVFPLQKGGFSCPVLGNISSSGPDWPPEPPSQGRERLERTDTRLERGKERRFHSGYCHSPQPFRGCPSKGQPGLLHTWCLDVVHPWPRLPRALTLLALASGPREGFPWLDASKMEEPSFRVA